MQKYYGQRNTDNWKEARSRQKGLFLVRDQGARNGESYYYLRLNTLIKTFSSEVSITVAF